MVQPPTSTTAAQVDGKSIAILIVVSLIVAVHICQTLYAFGVVSKLKVLCRKLRTIPSSLCDWRRRQEVSALERQVAERVLACQIEQVRIVMQLMSVGFFCMAASFISKIVQGGSLEDSMVEIVLVLLGYVFVLVPIFFPSAYGRKTMDLWLALILTTAVLYASPVTCGRWLCPKPMIIFTRAMVGLLAIARMSNFVAAVGFSAYTVAVAPQWCLDPGVSPPGDIGYAVSIAAMAFFLRRWATRSIRKVVEIEFLQERQIALRGVLKNFCEVVLELNNEMNIVGPAQDLGVFLLHELRVTLEGRKFVDFLTAECRNIVERLQVHDSRRSIAEVMHAHMRNSDNTSTEVELFCFGFSGPVGGSCYVVGIREYSDNMHGVPKREARSKDSKRSHGASMLEDPRNDQFTPLEQEVSVTVDTSNPELPILQSTAHFQILMGSTPTGSGLRRLVCNGTRYSSWVQTMMNKALASQQVDEKSPTVDEQASSSNQDTNQDSDAENPKNSENPKESSTDSSTFEVRFRPQAGIQTIAKCNLVFMNYVPGGEDDDDDDDDERSEEPLIAKLVFSDVERKRHVRSRSSASSNPSSCSSGSLPSFAGAFDAKNGRGRRLQATVLMASGVNTLGTKREPSESDTGSLREHRRSSSRKKLAI